MRDLLTIAVVVAAFAIAGLLLPRCSLDLIERLPNTPTTTTPGPAGWTTGTGHRRGRYVGPGPDQGHASPGRSGPGTLVGSLARGPELIDVYRLAVDAKPGLYVARRAPIAGGDGW